MVTLTLLVLRHQANEAHNVLNGNFVDRGADTPCETFVIHALVFEIENILKVCIP